jgi:hypothetical protein
MSEGARRKDRYGDEVSLSCCVPTDVFREGHLRTVELVAASHAIEYISRMVLDDEVEVDPLRLNLSTPESFHTVIETTSKRDWNSRGHLLPTVNLIGGLRLVGRQRSKGTSR